MKDYKLTPEYKAYQDALEKNKAAFLALSIAEGESIDAEEKLAQAICKKFQIGQKVKFGKHIGTVVGFKCRGSWYSDKIAPHYVLKKVKKDGSVSQINLYHVWAVEESELRPIE